MLTSYITTKVSAKFTFERAGSNNLYYERWKESVWLPQVGLKAYIF